MYHLVPNSITHDRHYPVRAKETTKHVLLVCSSDDQCRRGAKVKELQERCIVQAFKLKNQEKYEHIGPKVTSIQDGKRSQVDDKRLRLIDDIKKLKITYKSSLKEQVQA
ncbi:hypothetical protein Tco_0681872 [Tanacetum coccineum]|uniref:Uncharacterized protein n=1 Tax=Tanacetum coccineum TaxID=301880 RepID=A0ABQ4XRG0_9ASTR